MGAAAVIRVVAFVVLVVPVDVLLMVLLVKVVSVALMVLMPHLACPLSSSCSPCRRGRSSSSTPTRTTRACTMV